MTVSPILTPVHAPVDERAAAVCELLSELLAEARAGQIRSVFVSCVSADGARAFTRWDARSGDPHTVVGMMETMKFDLLFSRAK